MDIKKSKDFKDFNFFDLNRPIKSKHVSNMRDKIAIYGQVFNLVVITTKVFTGTPLKYIADGQHRFKAMKDLKMPFSYINYDFDDKREIAKFIASLNSTSLPWGLDDYLHAWATIGIDSYVIMSNKKEDSGILTTNLVSFYSLQQSGGRVSRMFKDGEFTIHNLELSTHLIDTYQKCLPYMTFDNWTEKSKFCDWIVGNHPDQNKLLNIIKTNKIPGDSVKETLDKLYN